MQAQKDEFADAYYEEKRRRAFADFFKLRNLASLAIGLPLLFIVQANLFHVLPSRLGSIIVLGVTGLLSVAAGINRARAKRPPRADGSEPQDKITATIGVILACFMFLPLIFFNFGVGLYTELTGVPGQQMEIIGGWYSGRHGCAGPTVESVFIDINIVCMDSKRRREFPEGGHMYVSGPVSPLGMNVESADAHW